MAQRTATHRYRPTEPKFKGGAAELYVTYDLKQRTRGGDNALYPRVKRVYIAGDVKRVSVGRFRKRTGRRVRGVRIEYEQSRKGYRRSKFAARRGGRAYSVSPASIEPTRQRFTKVVEVPGRAQNVKFYPTRARLPVKYRHALQRIR